MLIEQLQFKEIHFISCYDLTIDRSTVSNQYTLLSKSCWIMLEYSAVLDVCQCLVLSANLETLHFRYEFMSLIYMVHIMSNPTLDNILRVGVKDRTQ